MKRILTIAVSAVILTLSLSSCALFEAATAYGLYSKAAKTIEKAGGYEADCTVTMGIELLGEMLEIESKMNMKQNGENSSMVTESYGVVTETVMVDGVVYVDLGDSKTKYTVPEDTAEVEENEPAADIGLAELPDLAKEVFENIEVVINEDKTKSIQITLDEESAKELLGSMEDIEDLGEGESVKFENVLLTMNFTEKNVLDTMSFSADLVATVMGFDMTSVITAEFKFINFGTAPEISAPADADSYDDGGVYSEDLV